MATVGEEKGNRKQPTRQQLMEALAERRNNMRVADKPQDFSQFPL